MICDLLRIIRFFMQRCAEKRGGVTLNRGLAFTGKIKKRHFAVIQSWRAEFGEKVIRKKTGLLKRC